MKTNSEFSLASRGRSCGAASWYLILALAGIAVAGFGIYRMRSHVSASNTSGGGSASTTPSAEAPGPAQAHGAVSAGNEERNNAYREAMREGAEESATWPTTPESLSRDFWNAAHRKDYDRMALLCPGSVKSDFKTHYDQWTPSPAAAVGAPETHPTDAAVSLYPVAVSFPGFPNKTVKMAVRRAEDGRLVIDGRRTIWW